PIRGQELLWPAVDRLPTRIWVPGTRNRLPSGSQEGYGPSGRGLRRVHLGNVGLTRFAGPPRCSTTWLRIAWRRVRSDGAARPLAVPLLALQREGALGARLEGHRARAALTPARLPRSSRPLDDGAEVATGPRARRGDDPRLDAHHRAPRARPARARALPGRRGRPPPRGPRAAGASPAEGLGPPGGGPFSPRPLPKPDSAAAAFPLGWGPAPRRVYRALFPALRVVMNADMKIDAARAAHSREKVLAALDRIEAELQPSGYLVGDRFSVADLTAAALLAPVVMPPEFPYPPPERARRAIAEVGESFGRHPALEWVAEMYRRHPGSSADLATPPRP